METHPLIRHQPGQAAIVIALVIVLLVGMAGLGLDGANAFNQRRNAANAADAAAMDGANALIQQQRLSTPGPSSAVYSAIASFLNDHGIDPTAARNPWTPYYVDSSGTRLGTISNSSAQINTSAKGVSLDMQHTIDTWFMQMFGQSTVTVGATATAIFGPHRIDGGDLLPITMSKDAAQDMKNNAGTAFVFGPDSGAFKIDPGNFGAVSLNPNNNDPNATGSNGDCSSTTALDTQRYYWCNGTAHQVSIGDWLYGNPGELSGNVRSEVQWRIANRPYGLIPIYDTSNDLNGNNTKFRIVGFLVVEVTAEHLTGGTKTITAKYKNYITSEGALDPNAPVSGLYAINLIQ